MSDFVIVTGGAGYIGSHACKALKKQGFTPVTLDNLKTGWQDSVLFGPLEKGDLLDRDFIDKVFKKYKPIAVMHFAALSQVGESIQKPGIYWENNVIGSLNLIQSSIKHNCMKFIFSSTCATYGDQDNLVLDELSPQNPINAYGASKHSIEKMLFDFEKAYGLKHVIFRYFNVAGADYDAQIGEYHRPETHLIPLVLDALSRNDGEVKIYGTNYNTHDGSCIRDYVHVCDIVDAHILGLRFLQDDNNSCIFNLGTGHGFSVREVIHQAKIVTNGKIQIIECPRRKGDCAKLVSNSSLAKSLLDWSPDRSSLEQMISDAWRWQKSGFYSN